MGVMFHVIVSSLNHISDPEFVLSHRDLSLSQLMQREENQYRIGAVA
jgi:hypothetical protein